MTIYDQSEEQARLRSGHRLKAEFINQQQRRRHILAPLQPRWGQAGVDLQRGHQLVEAEILHREALLDRSDAQTHAQMRLAHPWRPLDQNRLGRAHPPTGGQRVNPRALDGRLKGKVEVLQRLPGRQVGQLQRGLDPPRLPPGQLRLEQDVEEGMRRDLLAHGVTEHLVEMLGGMRAAQSRQPLTRGVDVELGLGCVHRATSAKAA